MLSHLFQYQNYISHRKSSIDFFILAVFISISSIFGAFCNANTSFAVFSAENCPAGTLYKTKPLEAKEAKDIHTLAECNMRRDDKNLMDTVNQILNVIIGVIGFVTVAVIVLGGVLYATSQGDTAKITKAKNAILYGIVGLIIAILAFAIVNFVLTSVFGGTSEEAI